MNSSPAPAWPAAVLLQIDSLCLRFEAAWQSDTPPRLETYLGEVDDTARPLLFQELLALELAYRCRGGDTPEPEEYASRFPEHESLIRPLFSDVATTAELSASTHTSVRSRPKTTRCCATRA